MEEAERGVVELWRRVRRNVQPPGDDPSHAP
jgi:hypothetical protein